MAGIKGMKHFGSKIIYEVLVMKKQGNTNQEIAEHFGLERIQIKNLLERYKRSLKYPKMPKPKGRPRKQPPSEKEQMEKEINELKMKVELLEHFLTHLEGGDA